MRTRTRCMKMQVSRCIRMKILIVTEAKELSDSLEKLLKSKGLETETVYSGETGGEYAELGIYDLMILEDKPDRRSGYEVSRRLRQKYCRIPIILLTDKNDLESRIKGLKSGIDYCIVKPFDNREMLASVDALLQRVTSQTEEPYYGNTRLVLASGRLVCGEHKIRLSAK